MARFSVEDGGEGPSSPKRRRAGDDGPPGGGEFEDPADEKTISVRIDPDVLDCVICFEPLSTPVFQCQNGHIACSSCCFKIKNKCHSCSSTIGTTRCLAIEKVIEAIKIPCQNSLYGCKETPSYASKSSHEELCLHAPCKCPISDCQFISSSKHLSLHLSCTHSIVSAWFRYKCPFKVSLARDDALFILHGEDGNLFLINSRNERIGNVVFLTHVGPSSWKGGYAYDLITRKGERSIQLYSFTESIPKLQKEPSSRIDYLVVPFDYYSCLGPLGRVNLEVQINGRMGAF